MEGRLHFLKGQMGQVSLRKQYPLGICSIKDFSGLAAIMQLYAFSQKFHVNDSIIKGLNCSSANAYESQNLTNHQIEAVERHDSNNNSKDVFVNMYVVLLCNKVVHEQAARLLLGHLASCEETYFQHYDLSLHW